MASIDYSKWDHIEVSDDEDDTHPNIDTPSLYRWRHRARIERDEEFKNEKKEIEEKYKHYLTKIQNYRDKIKRAEEDNSDNLSNLKAELAKLEIENEEFEKKRNEFIKKEKHRPWNIDSICKEGKTKTIINSFDTKDEAVNEKDVVDRMKAFVQKYDKDIKNYGMLRKVEDMERFLKNSPHLVCEDTANHLVIWCIDLCVEEKTELMNHVSHQCIVMQFILELAKSLKRDPRDCIMPFFKKFRSQEPEYKAAFDSELEAFRDRIKERAKIRIDEAMASIEAEERQKRLGPGGLDPVEVFAGLPKELQECFEKKDIQLLQKTLGDMEPELAEKYLKQCIGSGMWLPDANKKAPGDGSESPGDPCEDEECDYAECSSDHEGEQPHTKSADNTTTPS